MSDYRSNLLAKAINTASGLLVSVVLARFLGVEARGEMGFITQTGSIAGIILGLGLNQAFMFQLKSEAARGDLSGVYRRTVGLLLAQIAALSALALVVSAVAARPVDRYLVWVSLAVTLYQQLESIMAAYDIQLKIRVNMIYGIFRLVAHLLMWRLASPSLGWPVAIAITGYLLASAAYLSNGTNGRPHLPTVAYARTSYRFGWLPMLSTLLVVLNYNVDIVMLRGLGDSKTELGLYVVAAGIVTYLWVIPDAVKEVLVSRVVRSDRPDLVLRPLKAAVVAALLSVLAVVIAGPFLIVLLFGAEYRGSYGLLLVLSVGVIPMVYYKMLGVTAIAEGSRGFYFLALLAASMLNIGANLWSIPMFGAYGAAFTSVASYVLTGGLFVGWYCRRFGLSIANVLTIRRRDIQMLRAAAWSRH